MCGRFTLHTPESRIREAFHLEHTEPLGLAPRFNIAPSQDIPVVRDTETGPEMVLARWGLVPGWSKEPKTRYSTINAKIESVAEKPTYRTPFRHRRCLIPADGFYEWKVVNGHKIPHHMRSASSACSGCPRAPSLDAAHQFTLSMLRPVRPAAVR